MPATTICHFTQGNLTPVCGADDDNPVTSPNPGDVTCFRCRRVPAFVRAQTGDRIGTPIPLPQRQTPTLLKDIVAANQDMQALHRAGLVYVVKRGLNSGTNDGEHEALVELADALGLTYDEDTDTYS